MVDDTHFRHAGLKDRQLLGYYMTEEEGQVLKVMPIDKTLRYTVPFRPLTETLDYFRSVASEDGQRVVINADDGEKFGVWPKTYNSVYEQGWLESFCRMLEEQSSWVTTMHLGTVVDTLPPQGRIYLPTASYSEMMKWALNSVSFLDLERFEQAAQGAAPARAQCDVCAGRVLAEFPGQVSRVQPHAQEDAPRRAPRPERTRCSERNDPEPLLEKLWAGQCNDPYWHGVFGGLYLPNLRLPVYRSLLDAEGQLDKLEARSSIRSRRGGLRLRRLPGDRVESPTLDFCLAPSVRWKPAGTRRQTRERQLA